MDGEGEEQANIASGTCRPCGKKEKTASLFVGDASALNGEEHGVAPMDAIEEIDLKDADNPQDVHDYTEEIHNYLRQQEKKFQIDGSYLERQTSLSARRRRILTEWLIEVFHRFDICHDAKFLTFSIIDRYLSRASTAIHIANFQLLGITAMFIASKVEEIYPPTAGDFIHMTGESHTKEEMLAVEAHVLRTIDFMVTNPTPFPFLKRAAKANCRVSTLFYTMALFILMLMQTMYETLVFLPSKQSAAALYVSNEILGRNPVWDATLEFYTMYTAVNLSDCVERIKGYLKKEWARRKSRSKDDIENAVYTMFSRPKYLNVAKNPQLVIYMERLN